MLSIIVFGASGDLARRKNIPGPFGLFRRGLIQSQSSDGSFTIIGYARSVLSREDFQAKLLEFLAHRQQAGDDEYQRDLMAFLDHCHYRHGDYSDGNSFEALARDLEAQESNLQFKRIFLLGPAAVSLPGRRFLNQETLVLPGNVRLIVEKPFGHDLQSSTELSAALRPLFGRMKFSASIITSARKWSRICSSCVSGTFSSTPFGTGITLKRANSFQGDARG